MKRVLTALVLIPLVLFGVFGPYYWYFFALVAVVAGLCFHEFATMAGAAHDEGALGQIGGLIAGLLVLWAPPERIWQVLLVYGLFALVLTMAGQDLARNFHRATALGFGLVYVFGAWRCAIELEKIDRSWLFFGLAVNWIGDSAAYYVGRRYGRHKLAPTVSPGKSWEGSVASACSAMLFGVLVLPWLVPTITTPRAAMLALAANLAGQFGDLAESAVKRAVGVKDSGTLLPGHGGMLDRVDSALFSLPVLYLFLMWA